MSVTLSAAEAAALMRTATVVATPTSYGSVDAWRSAVNAELMSLVGADSAGFILPLPGLFPVHSDEHDLAALGRFDEVPIPLRADGRHVFERAMEMKAATLDEIFSGDTGPFYDSAHYNELAAPSRAHDTLTTAVPLPIEAAEGAIAAVLLWHERPDGRRFGEHERTLLQMVAPALQAGASAAVRVGSWGAGVATLLSELSHPALVCDTRGAVVHRTSRLQQELALEPEAERVVKALTEVARSLVRFGRSRPSTADGGALFTSEVVTSRARYAIHGSLVASPTSAGERLAVAGLERLTPVTLSPAELQQRYRLTPAEVRVAEQLATGAATADMAAVLCLSPHTVRRHIESILAKFDVRSRTELLSCLLR